MKKQPFKLNIYAYQADRKLVTAIKTNRLPNFIGAWLYFVKARSRN